MEEGSFVVGFNPNLDGWKEFSDFSEALKRVQAFVISDPSCLFCAEDEWDQVWILGSLKGGEAHGLGGKELYDALIEHGLEVQAPEGFTFDIPAPPEEGRAPLIV